MGIILGSLEKIMEFDIVETKITSMNYILLMVLIHRKMVLCGSVFRPNAQCSNLFHESSRERTVLIQHSKKMGNLISVWSFLIEIPIPVEDRICIKHGIWLDFSFFLVVVAVGVLLDVMRKITTVKTDSNLPVEGWTSLVTRSFLSIYKQKLLISPWQSFLVSAFSGIKYQSLNSQFE